MVIDMAAEKMQLRITTPEDIKFDESVEMVIMRCISGDMGILPHHEPYSAILDFGVLRILNEGEERKMALFGGLAQVRDNVVTIIANDAQWPEDIDIAFVQSERERAAARLKEDVDDLDIQRDLVIMRRTLVQTEVSAYPLISKVEKESGEDK
jgi:F-type H+-transporting ATPase subunit epsilon